jgi:hypothetical protein
MRALGCLRRPSANIERQGSPILNLGSPAARSGPPATATLSAIERLSSRGGDRHLVTDDRFVSLVVISAVDLLVGGRAASHSFSMDAGTGGGGQRQIQA